MYKIAFARRVGEKQFHKNISVKRYRFAKSYYNRLWSRRQHLKNIYFATRYSGCYQAAGRESLLSLSRALPVSLDTRSRLGAAQQTLGIAAVPRSTLGGYIILKERL